MTFEELGLDEKLLKGIHDLGFTEPTPIQEKAIPVLLSGTKDLIGLAQTGTGKTAAFLLPIISRLLKHRIEGQISALIIVPTRELAKQIDDQVEGLLLERPLLQGGGEHPRLRVVG